MKDMASILGVSLSLIICLKEVSCHVTNAAYGKALIARNGGLWPIASEENETS